MNGIKLIMWDGQKCLRGEFDDYVWLASPCLAKLTSYWPSWTKSRWTKQKEATERENLKPDLLKVNDGTWIPLGPKIPRQASPILTLNLTPFWVPRILNSVGGRQLEQLLAAIDTYSSGFDNRNYVRWHSRVYVAVIYNQVHGYTLLIYIFA